MINQLKNIIISVKNSFRNSFPYLSYLYDKKRHSSQNIHYYNFRPTENFRINEFIKFRNISTKPIDYISVFWPRKVIKYLKNKKIFFTWEDISKWWIYQLQEYDDYLLNDVDLSIWFREYDKENYIRFPLRIIYLIDPWMRYEDIKYRLDKINNRNKISRYKFCSLIARHDKNWERQQIYKRLEKYGNIDCPWTLLHNLNINLPDRKSKRKFMEDYRFNICMENHSEKWYVTEKLVDALRSKCIPIYNWVFTDFEKMIINKDAIISTLDKDWFKKVEKIEMNNKNYNEFISTKPFKKDAAIILSKHLDLLEYKLRTNLNQ